ncbi:hypothetical protein EGR_08646 [Echinococcus granulosus]|uniref:Uncharacterized protein n=1 Tax=Echinococcus granulosus TaxID=6210 RepID=W6USV3_ECHGR|nr:hypothetical protein EGR_08646 [Echinococcus granulosus]EUB56469.1 hypothetical protein EGR_08646 [Echinococcus granulosus]
MKRLKTLWMPFNIKFAFAATNILFPKDQNIVFILFEVRDTKALKLSDLKQTFLNGSEMGRASIKRRKTVKNYSFFAPCLHKQQISSTFVLPGLMWPVAKGKNKHACMENHIINNKRRPNADNFRDIAKARYHRWKSTTSTPSPLRLSYSYGSLVFDMKISNKARPDEIELTAFLEELLALLLKT